MRYGSRVCRQGRSRPFRRYQSRRRRRNHCRLTGGGRAASLFRGRLLVLVIQGRGRQTIACASEGIRRNNEDVKIYTRTGDGGDTGLFDGTRVSKNDARVAAYGEVDELNAWLGFARATTEDPALTAMLEHIQRDLFGLGARLADPSRRIADRVTKASVTADDIARLEG